MEPTSHFRTQPVIELEHVSVCYTVPDERIGTFKEYIIRFLQNKVRSHDFLALTDINLVINKGETFGIIGPNGAGKSTLLKVVSRVLIPGVGHVRILGKVAPLLELGAGFHPELTGRENIFLNGTLLGHSQHEIKYRLDEILDFAQVDGFIDSPLRTYSSGMVARLGFAVATAWEPEILILDETLAVGDEEFRKKCKERMIRFRENGTTILLVSHDLAAVENLCTRAAWLDQGQVKSIGEVGEIIQTYRELIRCLPF
jgi:lipopolysaccharide transport system ATP-binding protein